LLAPLIEAANIIEREMGGKTAFKQRREGDVWDSVVVSLLREEGVKLEDALKNVVGRHPAAVKKLRDFRKNLKREGGPKA
jgi:hypothetical protein